jgi:hypothetical protein
MEVRGFAGVRDDQSGRWGFWECVALNSRVTAGFLQALQGGRRSRPSRVAWSERGRFLVACRVAPVQRFHPGGADLLKVGVMNPVTPMIQRPSPPAAWLCAVVVSLLAAAAAPGATPAREIDLLRQFPAGRLTALVAAGEPDAQGLLGGNRSEGHWIGVGTQRGGCWFLIGAVVASDVARADHGWRSIDAAFARQLPDGSFEAGPTNDASPADPRTASVQGTFFYLQELSHALLVIRQSPMEPHFHDRIAALEPKIRRACEFITAGHDTIIANSTQAVNRIIIAAKAFGLSGLVLHDEGLVATARKLVAYALTLRDPGGVFIEKGGRDSSYNAVSIFFGEVLALHVPLPELEAAFPAAMAWEKTRILPTGEVLVEGNSRTGVGKETYLGHPKGVNYKEIVFTLTFYGLVHHDAQALALADQVFAWLQAHPK